ncbi:MAG: patatin-like phospholipase family protein [Dehalococcoidia bacterium]
MAYSGNVSSSGRQEESGRSDPPETELAFVLSGGGSLGSVQVGCLESLIQNRIFPDLIVGTSVGALNGVWLAKNVTLEGVTKLKELWLSLGPHGPFRESRIRVLMRLLLGRKYLYANETLRKLVCQYVGDTNFDDLQVPIMVIATEMETGKPEVFSQGKLEPAVLASTAIPGVFPSVKIGNVEYIDGAMMSNCGLKPAWDHGARRMVVIETPHILPDRGYGVLKPLVHALSVSLRSLCHLEVELFSQKCSVVVLEPEVSMQTLAFNDFSRSEVLMEMGKAWTNNLLQSDQGELLRSFSKP